LSLLFISSFEFVGFASSAGPDKIGITGIPKQSGLLLLLSKKYAPYFFEYRLRQYRTKEAFYPVTGKHSMQINLMLPALLEVGVSENNY
jgi:hypothetical protein